ncbi:hypothetical protein C0J52_14605, partial [Blattella germanica]
GLFHSILTYINQKLCFVPTTFNSPVPYQCGFLIMMPDNSYEISYYSQFQIYQSHKSVDIKDCDLQLTADRFIGVDENISEPAVMLELETFVDLKTMVSYIESTCLSRHITSSTEDDFCDRS